MISRSRFMDECLCSKYKEHATMTSLPNVEEKKKKKKKKKNFDQSYM